MRSAIHSQVFWTAFWVGFGRFMAIFVALYLVLALVGDTSSANFVSAMLALAFAAICSVLYGFSRGDEAVREARWQSGE
jgi:hypothetical protein